MARKKSTSLRVTKGKVTRTNANVRIYPPAKSVGKKTYWRIVWMEDKQQKETTATSNVLATKKALEISKAILAGGTSNPQKTCGEMIDDYFTAKLDPDTSNWGDKHALNLKNLFKNHITPSIENISCIDLRNKHLQKLVNGASTISLSNVIE